MATVNPTTGTASLLSVGSTTITATKAASNGFNQATTTYTLNVTKGTQTIAFAQSGPLQALKGFPISNTASGGAGTGAITYASSNPTAITVNSTSGAAVGVSAGSATITATKAADVNYNEAQATYTLTVQTQAPVSTWIGPNDSQVTLPAIANGMQFIRARDRNCNLANYSVCANGQSTIAAGATITDTAATTGATGYYWLQSGGGTTNATPINAKRFSERIAHTALFFNNRYWVIGGGKITPLYTTNSDVWSSADGKIWELETSNANFGPRLLHQSVVYAGKMWVIGGLNVSGFVTNDVWSSTDGVTWTQVVGSLPFGGISGAYLNVVVFNGAMWAVSNGSSYSSTDGVTWTLQANGTVGGSLRAHASLAVYGGKLWYIGGAPNFVYTTSGNAANDVWSSPDGVNWTQVTGSASFSPRILHSSFVMNGRLWVFGGEALVNGVEGALTPDAWSTTDGVTWTAETAASKTTRSYYAATVQEANKVTLIGGIMPGYSNKVWQSTDGNQWTELSPYAQFSPRSGAAAVEFQGDLWQIGGYAVETRASNEIWRSSDGLAWTRVMPVGPVFLPRAGHQLVVFNGRLWVIGGGDVGTVLGGTDDLFNDVWSSADGVNWTQHVPVGAIFSPRSTQAVVFNSKLWVIGGLIGSNTTVNDVWSTSDGVHWTQETTGAAFTPRYDHAVVAFNGSLWLFGGFNVNTPLADIWRSTDGINWNPVTPAGAAFPARFMHAATIYNNRMWIIGGRNGTDYATATRFNDVWSTADGANWTQHTAAAQFGPRYEHTLVNHNNELWVIGGFNLDTNNEVWRSTDGINWRVGFSSSFMTQ